LPVLLDLIKKLEEAYTVGVRDVESDLAFHYQLVNISGNKTIKQLWLSINGLIRTLIEVTSSIEELNQSKIIYEHKQIINYLIDEDYKNAQNLVEKHLESVQILITRKIK